MTDDVKVAPKRFYYISVDGTNAIDSAVFGKLLEKSAPWKNLFNEFLTKAPEDPARLVDPAHTGLPIWLVNEQGKADAKGAAVVCPNGLGSTGMEAFWRDPGEPKLKVGSSRFLEGRHAACERSARFMKRLFLEPAVAVDAAGKASLVDGAAASGSKVVRADMVYMSSHGWLGGFMKGETLRPRADALPASATGAFTPGSPYFLVGEAVKEGRAFLGPQYLVLAQCSTANSATWPLWVQLMAKGSPPVRGILAYEEASPDAVSCLGIARAFFNNLRTRRLSFLEAWKSANAGQNWAAIVHKDALGDRLEDWGTWKPLGGGSAVAGDQYVGYLSSIPKGTPVDTSPPPFEVHLYHGTPASPEDMEILPENLSGWEAVLKSGDNYRVTVRAATAEPLAEATIEWIHIRPTKTPPCRYDWVFDPPSGVTSEGTKVAVESFRDQYGQKDRVRVTAGGTPTTQLTIDATVTKWAQIAAHHVIEAHHSYFWLRVTLKTVAGAKTLTYDFKTRGILYYGEIG